MSTKDTVAQNVFTHMELYRLSPLLDQMASGLKKSGVLRMVQAFPDLYAQHFLYCGRLSAEDVLQAVCVDEEQTELERDPTALAFFKRYIEECDEVGKSHS